MWRRKSRENIEENEVVERKKRKERQRSREKIGKKMKKFWEEYERENLLRQENTPPLSIFGHVPEKKSFLSKCT